VVLVDVLTIAAGDGVSTWLTEEEGELFMSTMLGVVTAVVAGAVGGVTGVGEGELLFFSKSGVLLLESSARRLTSLKGYE
jgi:hypothetical protein